MDDLKTILLAEDSAKDAELVLAALEEHRLADQVFVVRDGAEALDYLLRRGPFSSRSTGNPVVVLLDLKMPKVNGIDVLRAIRKEELLKALPVVILTSSREEKDVGDSYHLGANAYVVKPVDFGQFIQAVKDLGIFWARVNEPPPGSLRSAKSEGA